MPIYYFFQSKTTIFYTIQGMLLILFLKLLIPHTHTLMTLNNNQEDDD